MYQPRNKAATARVKIRRPIVVNGRRLLLNEVVDVPADVAGAWRRSGVAVLLPAPSDPIVVDESSGESDAGPTDKE